MATAGTPGLARAGATTGVAALVAVLVVLPLLRLAQVVWQESGGHVGRVVGSAVTGAAVRNTVVLAVAVTVVAVPIGVGAHCRVSSLPSLADSLRDIRPVGGPD